MKKNYEASIIVMNRNRKKLLFNCLEAIEKNTKDVNYELIIVDSLSLDGSRELLFNKYQDKATLIFEKDDTSYAVSNNKAMKWSSGKYIYLLNNDCIPHVGWLRNAIDYAENDKQIGHVASLVLWPDSTVMSYGCNITKEGYSELPFSKCLANIPELQRPGNYAYAGFGLYRRDLLEEIGYLPDFDVPIYFDDTHYGMEIWRLGFNVRFCPDSIITHTLYHTDRSHHNGAQERGLKAFMNVWSNFLQENDGFAPDYPFTGKRPWRNNE